MRRLGDAVADAVVSDHAQRNPRDLGRLMGELFRSSRMPEKHPLIAAYLSALPAIALQDQERIERGQRLFSLFGPEALLILGSCGLPLAYAAGNGVQAIYRSRRLKEDPIRRLCDTAQMVLNVMLPGQLEHGRVGWYSTRKVRLIHSLVRYHVQADPAEPWVSEWGTPINQEDLAGTLLTFSVAVLYGLRKMGAKISQEDADDYVFAWSAIGRLLGVDEALLSTTEAQGMALAKQIGARQIRPTPEGKEFAEQLLNAVGSLFPINGYALSLTHFFLEDTAFGADVARVLQLPDPNWTKWLVQVRAAQKRAVLSLLPAVPGAGNRRSFVARRFAQAMILLKRPDDKVPFEVPTQLRTAWGL